MKNTYMIRVCSTKGGVGKTTVAVNLATALQLQGYSTLVVDEDCTNPCVGLYLGLQDVNIGIFDVMKSKVDMRRAIIPHATTGLHVLPGKLGYTGRQPTKKQITTFFGRLKSSEYDYVIVDTQPGIPFPDSLSAYDEALIVAQPYEASNLSALRMAKEYSKHNLKVNVAVNMVRNKRYELSLLDIQELSEAHVISALPADEEVPISMAEHIPLYVYNRRAMFSKAIADLANVYATRVPFVRESPPKGSWFFSRLKKAGKK